MQYKLSIHLLRSIKTDMTGFSVCRSTELAISARLFLLLRLASLTYVPTHPASTGRQPRAHPKFPTATAPRQCRELQSFPPRPCCPHAKVRLQPALARREEGSLVEHDTSTGRLMSVPSPVLPRLRCDAVYVYRCRDRRPREAMTNPPTALVRVLSKFKFALLLSLTSRLVSRVHRSY